MSTTEQKPPVDANDAVVAAWRAQGLTVEARDADDDLVLAGGARRRVVASDEEADEDADEG
jgi:hypothetical protein